MNYIQEVIEYLESRIAELKEEAKEHNPFSTGDHWDEIDVGFEYALFELNLLLEKIRGKQ